MSRHLSHSQGMGDSTELRSANSVSSLLGASLLLGTMLLGGFGDGVARAQAVDSAPTESAADVETNPDAESASESTDNDSAAPESSVDADDAEAADADAESTDGGTDESANDEIEADEKQEPDEEYYELLKLFADTLDQVERNYVEEVSRRELMEAAIKGVLGKLDQYSDYIPPDQFDNFRTGVENEFGGIGIRVGIIDGRLTVITPLIGTPAYRAGILTGDQILTIDGASTEGMSLEDAITRMKGRIGTTVQIRVRHKDDQVEEQVTVERLQGHQPHPGELGERPAMGQSFLTGPVATVELDHGMLPLIFILCRPGWLPECTSSG